MVRDSPERSIHEQNRASWNAVTGAHNSHKRNQARFPAEVRAAFKAMTTGRPGAAHLGIPFDVQKAPVPEEEIWGTPALGRYPAWPSAPDPEAVEGRAYRDLRAAIVALLNAAKNEAKTDD